MKKKIISNCLQVACYFLAPVAFPYIAHAQVSEKHIDQKATINQNTQKIIYFDTLYIKDSDKSTSSEKRFSKFDNNTKEDLQKLQDKSDSLIISLSGKDSRLSNDDMIVTANSILFDTSLNKGVAEGKVHVHLVKTNQDIFVEKYLFSMADE